MPLKRCMLAIVSLILLLLPKEIVTACGFYVAPGEYRFWLLQPDLTNTPDLTPFFFASTYLYKGDQFAGSDVYLKQNIEEWYHEIKGSCSKADIDSLLYSTAPKDFFNNLRAIEKENGFLRYLLKAENKELFRYMQLSKKVEEIAAHPDPWEERNFPVQAVNKIVDEAKVLFRQAASRFVKLRTSFQLVRLYAYNNETAQLNKTYNDLIEPVNTDSWVKTAALFQKALSDTAQQDYLWSKVFDRGNYNRATCLVYFNSSKLNSILPQAKNIHERTVLYAMKVFNYAGRSLGMLKTIYKNEPGYKELPFLLLREINKVEDWLVTSKVTGFDPAAYDELRYTKPFNAQVNYSKDKEYAAALYDFILQVIVEAKSKEPALLHLYAAHLAMLQQNYAASARHLAAAEAGSTSAKIKTQVRINKFLLSLEITPTIYPTAEKDLMGILQIPDTSLYLYDAAIMKDQLILYTARKMIVKGSKAKGLMLLSKTRRALGSLPISTYKRVYQEIEETALPQDYDTILNILSSKTKTPFEKFVAEKHFSSPMQYYSYYEGWDSLQWDRNRLLDGKASWYLRNNNLQAASAVLQKIPDGFWKKEPYSYYTGGNPFYINIYKPHAILEEDKLSYNKKVAINKMIRLLSLAKSTPAKSAECYYQLANAYYNMSYHGKNWLMVKQWWSISEMATYNMDLKRTPFNDVYYGCTIAKEYYLKAMNSTNDRKLAALCCFMAGQCNTNYNKYLWCIKNRGNYLKDFLRQSNPYLPAMRQKGVDERYYKAIVNECATYRSFINKYNHVL